MEKHVMAMTYVPKLDAVRDGLCKQTIRPGEKYSVDDHIMIHGWSGKPYRSKWSWRINVVVTEIYNVEIRDSGMHDHEDVFVAWDSGRMDRLAERDHIMPATGKHLYRVLCGVAGKESVGGYYQVIRWEVLP